MRSKLVPGGTNAYLIYAMALVIIARLWCLIDECSALNIMSELLHWGDQVCHSDPSGI